MPSIGGDTLFLNMYEAYDKLPAELKARVDGRKALNAYLYDSTTRGMNGSKLDLTAHPHYVQPVVRTHPDTHRKALYVNRLMTWSVEGMEPNESNALLDNLFSHIEQDQFIYAHKNGASATSFFGTIAVRCMRARIFPTRSAACCDVTSS